MAAPLDLFTLFNNTSLGATDDPNSSQAQAALRQVQAYDPSASYRAIHGSDGQLIGYQLTYDASKLPGPNGGQLASANTGDFVPNFSTVQDHMQLKNPGAVESGTPYGTITANSNINSPRSWVDTYGPAIVAAFGFGAPALLGGLQAAGAAGAAGAADAGLGGATFDTLPAYNPSYTDMLPFSPSASDIGLPMDMTGFQTAGGASGAWNSALGVPPPTEPPGFQIPGGVNGLFGVQGSGIDPSTANILNDINSPSLFDVGGPAGQALAGNATDPMPGGSTPGGSAGGSGSGFQMPSPSQILQGLSKIPGLTGGSSGGTGSGGGSGGGLLNMPPSQYGALTAIMKRYLGGGLLNGN